MPTQPGAVANSTGSREPVGAPAEAGNRAGLERRLTPRQRWLVRKVTGPPVSSAAAAFPSAAGQSFLRFSTAWTTEPIECIRALNGAVTRDSDPSRAREDLEAAVDLEILMDRLLPRGRIERIYRGIPSYVADGYTDLGTVSSITGRRGREKIKIDKQRLRDRLVEYRRRAVRAGEPGLALLADFYRMVQQEIAFDHSSVNNLCQEAGDRSILFSRYLEEGVGVCRHLSLAYQLCLQEAGIPSRMVKGTLRLFGIRGRHAWNLVWLRGQVALVDVALADRDGPLILIGNTQEQVYREAEKKDRTYTPSPECENYYRYGPVEDAPPGD